MDTRKFDELAIHLASGLDRRQLFRVMFGGALELTATGSLQQAAAAQQCASIQEGCLTHEQCCEGLFCGETGICIAAAECVSEGGGCEVDENCCDDRVYSDGICVDGISTGTTLPNTDVAPHGSSSAMTSASLAALGAAALTAAAFLRREKTSDAG